MARKYLFRFLAGLVIFIVIIGAITIYQKINREDVADVEVVDVYDENSEAEKKYENFYRIPRSLWPKITVIGTFSAVIVFVSLVFGIGSYFIGYNAGGKINKRTIFSSIALGVAVGILGRSFTVLLQVKLYEALDYILPIDNLLAATIAEVIVYIFWLIFICGISVYMYETFTVTAEEAHPTH